MLILDLSGLHCPLPIIKTKQQLSQMQPEQEIMVITTDPHAEIDFKAYLARTNHQLISCEIKNNTLHLHIKKM